MSSFEQLRPFFEPASVAVVGASAATGEEAFNVVENLVRSGYRGQVYPVNPKHGEIVGLTSYPTVVDIPGDVDLAVIVTPRRTVPGIIKQCADKGIRAAIVVGGGFADAADDEGKSLQQDVVEVARRRGVRVLGPNTVGSANAFIDFSTSFLRQADLSRRPIGLICQSGLFFGTVGGVSLLGKGLDLGNACDVGIAEALDYFEHDPEVEVIVLHIEGIDDGRRFREAARRAATAKPVLALKTGKSERAARAARSHTGSLVGRDDVWDALFKQCGVVRAADVDELGDLVRAFVNLPAMAGRGLAVVTAMGAVGTISADACAAYGMDLVELSPPVRRRLNELSPAWFDPGNPLDIWPLLMTSRRPLGDNLREVLALVLGDPGVDGLVLFAGAWFEVFSPPVTEIISEMAGAFPRKPIAWCPYEGWLRDFRVEDLAAKVEDERGAAVFSTAEAAVRALARMAGYSEFRSAAP